MQEQDERSLLALDLVEEARVPGGVDVRHGGTGTGRFDWEHVRPALAPRYRLLVPDLRGHGRSSDPGFLVGLASMQDDVLRVLEAVGERPACVVGFSIGARILLDLVRREPDVTATLVVIAPTLKAYPARAEQIKSAAWPPELIALEHEHGSGPDHWKALRARHADEFWRDAPDVTDDDLARLTLPTLAAWGDRDAIEPVENGLRLVRALPQGELLVLPAASHFLVRERPHELAVAIDHFLERHTTR